MAKQGEEQEQGEVCEGPGQDGDPCERPVYAKGMCLPHYRQKQRHPRKPLAPVREVDPKGVRYFNLRLPAEVVDKLEALRPLDENGKRTGTEYAAVQRALEEWAGVAKPDQGGK